MSRRAVVQFIDGASPFVASLSITGSVFVAMAVFVGLPMLLISGDPNALVGAAVGFAICVAMCAFMSWLFSGSVEDDL